MLSDFSFVTRPPQPYAAIRLEVQQDDIPAKAPPLIEPVLEWIGRHGEQAGPMFFNYTRMDGTRMTMEVGAPTTVLLAGDGQVTTATLPGGRYAAVTYTGPYDGLRDAHMALHDWLSKQALPPQTMSGGDMTLLEIYVTDPAEVPNPAEWVTRIEFKIAE